MQTLTHALNELKFAHKRIAELEKQADELRLALRRARFLNTRTGGQTEPPPGSMPVRLVFDDWRIFNKNKIESVYCTEKGVELSMGDFHSGTIFKGTITLNEDYDEDLAMAMEQGYQPCFYLIPAKKNSH